MRAVSLWLMALAVAFAGEGNETRYSASVTEEGEFAAGLRVPGADTGNLLLVKPSFAYKSGDRWRFSTSLAGVTQTEGDTRAQLHVKETYFDLMGDVDFTVGKRILRWGTGYAFTATGILDPPRVATDPTDRLNLYQGREMVKADWISGKHDFTFAWASAGVLDSRRPGMDDTTAFRDNVLAAGFDTSVIVAHEGGGANFAGANFTRVIGTALELHGEFAWRQGAAMLAGGKYTTGSCSLCVSGKGHRQTLLPLTQEIGDAIASYIEDGRPPTTVDALFIRSRAPFRALANHCAVSMIVAQAMRRAGVTCPSRGAAHVLRHSVASSMLRHGASLQEIAGVLRHRSIATAEIYAKVDVATLRQIAQPWPEAKPC